MKPALSPFLFWDCDTDKLDYKTRAGFVLERVFSMGTEKDVREAVRFYGLELIRREIVNIKTLDPKTVNYLSFTFNIPRRKFRKNKKNVYQTLY